MDAAGFSIVDNRAGVTFGVELYVPWDAPEMATDLSAKGTVLLRDVQDVFGMCGRRKCATESRILQGRDARSVRVLVPDCRGLEKNFHDIAVVDIGGLDTGVVGPDKKMASGGDSTHEVATAGAGGNATGG